MAVGEDKTRILITVTKDMKKELEIQAEKETRNVSNLVVSVLKEYIRSHKDIN
jgi:hypothetical protein